MNRLIIIGNGFDLAHGLKSRFIDFLDFYVKEFIEDFFKINNIKIVNSRFNIPPHDLKHEDILLMLRLTRRDQYKIGELYRVKGFQDFINNFNGELLNVKSDLLSSYYNQLNIPINWIDIESLYFERLIEAQRHRDKELIKRYNEQFEFIKDQFIKFIKDQLDKGIISDSSQNHLRFISDYKSVFYKGFHFNISDKLMFLNFNYTNLLKEHIKHHDRVTNKMINHIHGEIDDVYNPIIMGFGDEHNEKFKNIESDRNHELFRYIKSINYFKTRKYRELYNFLNSGNFEVFVIGHSCGLSDRTLLREIFENDACKSIRLFYYEDEKGNSDYFEKSVEVMRHFENKALVRKKIVPYNESDKMIQLSKYSIPEHEELHV